MFFTAPPPAAAAATSRRPPSIQRLSTALAAAASSSAAVPSLEAALAAALSAATTTATTTNKITVSFFNENGSSVSYSSSSLLSATSYSGFEVEDAGNGYDEAFLRGIVALDKQQLQPPTTKKLHPLSSLASSASSSLSLSVSVISRPRGGFETRVAEYSGGKLKRIRLQPPPGRARPGASVRVSIRRSSSASVSAPASLASASPLPSSPAASLVDVVLAFALAREDLAFQALDARTGRVLLESGSSEGHGGESGDSVVLRALGSPASPPSFSSVASSSMTANIWALVPPEGEVCPSSSSDSGPTSCRQRRRRLCFVSVDGHPLEAPSLEAEVDSLFAEICASLLGERRRGGGSGGGGAGSFQKERGTAARTRRVPAFVLKLSTTKASNSSSGGGGSGSGGCDDAARFCGRMGLTLLLSLGSGEAEAAARACVREAALSCWRAVAPARLLPDPLLPLGMPPPPPPQQQHLQKRARFSSNAPLPLRRAPRSAPAVLVSSASSLSSSSNNLLLSLHHRPPPRLLACTSATAAAPPFFSSQQQQHPDSILTLDQLTAGASALVTPRGGFDGWGALSARSGSKNSSGSSSASAARPLAQLTAIDGRGSPTFLVAVVETTRGRRKQQRRGQQHQQQQVLVAFDPHAAHERVRLEQLSEAYYSSAAGNSGENGDGSGNGDDRGGGCSLSLPLPRPCELRLPRDGDAAEALGRHAAGLARWGWRWRSRLDDDGEGGAAAGKKEEVVAVVSLTHAAAVAGTRLSAADFLDHARALLLSPNSSSHFASLPPPAAPRALASRACRGAYMFSAGHRLSAAEASALLDSLSRTASPGICAHGRPTASALVDLGKLRALLATRREARRGGEEMKKMKAGRATTATAASSSSLSAFIESLRLQVSRAEREEAMKNVARDVKQ